MDNNLSERWNKNRVRKFGNWVMVTGFVPILCAVAVHLIVSEDRLEEIKVVLSIVIGCAAITIVIGFLIRFHELLEKTK